MQLKLSQVASPPPRDSTASKGRFMLSRRVLVVCIGALLASCEESRVKTSQAARSAVDATDPDIVPLSTVTIALPGVVAITESDYQRAIRYSNFASAIGSLREDSLAIAAKANDVAALGITGNRENNVSLLNKTVIVLHNERLVSGQLYQATSFSVVVGQLSGQMSWALVGVSLRLTAQPAPNCSRPFRGCSVTGETHAFSNWEQGGLGLPTSIRLDAESATMPTNQLGHSIDAWVIPNLDVADVLWPTLPDDARFLLGNRYVCAEPLDESTTIVCEQNAQSPDLALPATPSSTALSSKVFLIEEKDFQVALLNGSFSSYVPNTQFAVAAAEIASALNDPHSVGVRGTIIAEKKDIEAEVLLVARSPRTSESSIEARRVFVVPGPIVIPVSRVAGTISIAGLDSSYFSAGVCGPVYFPGLEFNRDRPFVPTQFVSNQPGYGTDRYSTGMPRATLRWPVNFQGLQAIEVLACSRFEPPVPPLPPIQPTFKQEFCNGLDDNGNGEIDEFGCLLSACSGCVPMTTCGTRRCVSIPDGCGAIVQCACP